MEYMNRVLNLIYMLLINRITAVDNELNSKKSQIKNYAIVGSLLLSKDLFNLFKHLY